MFLFQIRICSFYGLARLNLRKVFELNLEKLHTILYKKQCLDQFQIESSC
jgi:hypothetical protein